MSKSRLAGIVIIAIWSIFLFKDDLISLIPVPLGPQVSQEIKDFSEKIIPYVTEENKQDLINIGNMLIHEGNLFAINTSRYSNDREIKAKLNETLTVSMGYQFGVDVSKYSGLTKVLVDKFNSSIGEEGFSSKDACEELHLIGGALRYAASK